MDLSQLRQQIDTIDRQIVDLYEKRMDVSRQVAEYKIETGKKVFDKQREQEKIAGVKALTHNDFNSHGVEELFEQIMSMSRKLQYQLLAAHGSEGRLPFIGVDELETECARVVYQGAEGSYSQAAMRKFFGENVNAFHVESFRDAMSAIDEGSADFAVLPIENSTAGIVNEIYDLLVEFENYIVGEQVIPIEHCLLALPGTKMEACYGTLDISERHRHRYEFNNDYRALMQEKGLVLSGLSPDGHIVETVEIPENDFYIGVQYHPEFKSRPNKAHPLFKGLISAALRHAERG